MVATAIVGAGAVAAVATAAAVASRCGEPNNLPDLPGTSVAARVWSFHAAKAQEMRGPSSTSNWVVQDLVLCGSEPEAKNEAEIGNILDLGISCFVCLQAEVGGEPAYKAVAERLHKERGTAKPFEFLWFPTSDGGTFKNDLDLKELVDKLVAKVLNGERIYVHCHGGHGRTGVVVACILGYLYPRLSPQAVLQRVLLYHNSRGNPQGKLLRNPGSPQTPLQRQQAERILSLRPSTVFRKLIWCISC